MQAKKEILLLFLLVVQACGSGDGSSSSSSSSGGGTAGGGGDVAGSPTSMSTGDVSYVDLSSGSGSASFPSSGKFEILLQSHAAGSSTNTYTLTSVSSSGKALGLGQVLDDLALAEESLSPQDLLDSTLRDNEMYYTEQPLGSSMSKFLFPASKSVSKGSSPDVSGAIAVNDTAKLYVLDSLTDTTDCTQITATAKYVSGEVAIFIDNEILDNNAADLPQSDIDSLGSTYSDQLPDLRSWFGSYSDINSDGVMLALISSRVNRLGGSGGGIVTGYFNSDDFSDNTASNPCSNDREIVYLVAPDSKGLYGTKITNAFWMSNFAPGVFPHEVQHLINHYQRVVSLGAVAEKACLNEGLSHLTEDLVGYNRENYSRYDLFLDSPQSYPACGGTSLAGRGAIYLFLRYLYERSGKDTSFLKNMVQTKNTGYDNIVAAFPSGSKGSDFDSIGEFIRQWGAALAYTDRGISTAAKFKYNVRVKNSTTNNWEGVCVICSAEDGRSTTLTGPPYGTFSSGSSYNLKDGTTRFLKLNSNPSKITFSAGSGASGYVVIVKTE